MVELIGIEPTTPCLQSRCSPKLSYSPVALAVICSLLPDLCYRIGGSGWIRTIDPRLIKTVL